MKSLNDHIDLNNRNESTPSNSCPGGFDIERVIRRVRRDYAKPVAIPVLARECGMSVRTLYRLYHSARGTTVAKDITRRRIEAAAEMLREPGLKLEPIAIRTGFGNAKNLCRRFKEHFGITPGQWRSKNGIDALSAHHSGFALVSTLGMMVLLLVLAVGLLGLSSVSLRTSSQSEASARAKANARMSLALAIGELQKQAGPDTRVTARADILSSSNPPVLGVWKSWEGDNHTATGPFAGRPVSPGNYAARKRSNFLAWLTSAESSSTSPPSTKPGQGTVALVGENSVGTGSGRDSLQIHLTPTMVSQGSRSGAMAWWVSGENQKARLPVPYEPPQDSPARWSVIRQSHSTADPGPFRLDNLFNEPALAENALSLPQTDLITTQRGSMRGSQEFFHDLTPYSIGLLTNTATGGWRKDLSLATENWGAIGGPNTNLPFFRVSPTQDLLVTKSGSNRSIFYPWSSYRNGNIPIYQHGAVASWENLKDYITAYKRVTANAATGRATMQLHSVAIDGNASDFLHKVRILPVIARIQWVYSHSAASTAQGFHPRLLVNPVVTLWNPYNVELTTIGILRIHMAAPPPTALRYSISGGGYRSLFNGGSPSYTALSSAGGLNYDITVSTPLRPGETRIFSHQGPVPLSPHTPLPLTPGFSLRGGHHFPLGASTDQDLVISGSASISVDAAFDTSYDDRGRGVGIYLNMQRNGQNHLAYRMTQTPELARQVYPPISGLGGITAGELASTIANPRPFLTTIFGARMASNTHLSAKGFVQSSPLVNYTAMGGKDQAEENIARRYGGTRHPVNSPFDFSFERLSAAGSDLLPNVADGNSGYIVSGFTSGTGASRCVVAGIPLRPLASLAELQHWDLRYENPIPPFAFNLIGNSDASPLLPPNAVVNTADQALNVNLQHDDSYCANHLLFDDWFFSTIAPNTDTFGSGGGASANGPNAFRNTYLEFVSDATPLANHAYRPILEDAASENHTTLFTDHVSKATSWRTIASRLEVEGMFNVNSTSVTAWRSLLGHARNQKIPHITVPTSTGPAWQVSTSSSVDHAVSRMSVAGDIQAGGDSFNAANSEIGGYQVFNDAIIDRLAEEIVAQVRLRGPFLSLSEFVNRQLSSGELALAGAIQTALNRIERDPGLNPFATIHTYSDPSVAEPPGHPAQEYKFPAAAIGYGAYGVPAWPRQADILRPLAPILSARDDTFTIRAYGDARDSAGKIIARATCEAVVRRTRDYFDPSDAADITTLPSQATNRDFGRRFQLVSFRWLHDSEI